MKGFINNTPIQEKKVVAPVVEEKKNVFAEFFGFGSKEKEPETNSAGPRKEELFVDLIEKLSFIMDGKVLLVLTVVAKLPLFPKLGTFFLSLSFTVT